MFRELFLWLCRCMVTNKDVYLHSHFLKSIYMEFELRKDEDYIQLTQLLKAVGIAENGAMAAAMVVAGEVELNGEKESRKRAKLRSGDIIRVLGKEIRIK